MILTLTTFYRMDVTPKQVAERRVLGKGARHWVKRDILKGMGKLGLSKAAIECVAKTYVETCSAEEGAKVVGVWA